MGKMRNAYKTVVRKVEGKAPSEDLGVEGTVLLEWVLEM
jgi:hypothetical protein